MAKAASTTTPVLPLFLMGAFCLPQTEEVEGFTAHLAENKLKTTRHKSTSHHFCSFNSQDKNYKQKTAHLYITTAGTKKAHHRRGDWHRGENAEPTHFPHILNVIVLLEIYSDSMHSIAGRFLLGGAPSRRSALGV